MIENNENKEIVRTVITLGQSLGMDVVAEGVETKQQFEQLRDLGCESGQGYLFSRPVDTQAAEKLIADGLKWQAAITCLEELFDEEGSQQHVGAYLM
jgi:EAL domain-containing protein (putative c-di-GMP-specific phosphodiesterase class I)